MARTSADAPPVAIAIAVVERDGKFLIGRRPEGVALAGLWEFPGGKIHAGESPEEAAVRECLEESGVVARVRDELATVLHRYDHGLVRLHFFACEVVEGSSSAREGYRWVTAAELANYEFPAANAELLRRLTGV